MIAVPLAIRLSRRYGVVAHPGGRHAHANRRPLLGGLAMWIGFARALLVFLPRDTQTLAVLVVSGLAMGLLIVDDRWSMPPVVKLGVQGGLALLAVAGFGIEIRFFSLPGGHLIQQGLLLTPVSVCWLLRLQDTVNSLHGADGLAPALASTLA